MKNTFGKKVLLMGAIAVSLSAVVPAHAMEKQIKAEAANSSMQDAQAQLKKHINTLDGQIKKFIKCVKTGENCTAGQRAIATTLSAVMLYVGVLMTKRALGAAANTRAGKYVAGTRVSRAVTGAYDVAGKQVSAARQYVAGTRLGQGVANISGTTSEYARGAMTRAGSALESARTRTSAAAAGAMGYAH